MRGKRASDEGFDWSQIPFKKIGIILLIIVVIGAAVAFSVHTIKKRKEIQASTLNTTQENEEEKNKMPEQVDGYDVLGQLVIEKIAFEQYVVDSTENDAMEKYPVKLYGGDINQIGNFCIAGHNYDEIFARLSELAVGDEFYMVDTEDVIQDYVVTEITEVEPTDLNCLMPVEDKIQVTLITCKEGATERLVIKAERVDIEV